MACPLAGARLDRHLDLLAPQRADGVRNQRHAALALPGFFGHAYLQGRESLFNGVESGGRRDARQLGQALEGVLALLRLGADGRDDQAIHPR